MIAKTRKALLPDSKAITNRTKRQPLVWICFNLECRAEDKPFLFASDYPKCPKCTSSGWPTVKLRTLIHLLVPDNHGPISGRLGRYRIACDPKRQYTSRGLEKEAATNFTYKANCGDCRKWLETHGIKGPTVPKTKEIN